MRKPKHELRTLGLFEGIGGIALGLERTGGFTHTAFCEIEPYCQAVLRKHWPDVPIHSDVHDLHGAEGEFDLITGGFPCQPVSLAGRRKAQADERWLWPEFARLVGEIRPRYVLVENVRGLCSKGLDEVLADLAGMGYDAEWQVVSAASVGAPHLRERVLLVAYPVGEQLRDESGRGGGENGQGPAFAGLDGPKRTLADADSEVRDASRGASQEIPRSETVERPGRRCSSGGEGTNPDPESVFGSTVFGFQSYGAAPGSRFGGNWAVEPDVGRVAHGVPSRVDRLRTLGNAVVPQVAEFVGGLILDHYERTAHGRSEP